jgi:hypothetical protein
MTMRIAYSGLIYRKVGIVLFYSCLKTISKQVLRLSSHSVNALSSGKIVNLLSNDAGQIEMALIFINFLWVSEQVQDILMKK